MIPIGFDDCFPRRKIRRLMPLLPKTYAALDKLAPWREGRWPNRIKCMSDAEIADGRSRGAGHGYVIVPGDVIWLSPYLTWQGMHLVLIHENLHIAFPDATEDEINSVLLPKVYKKAMREELDMNWARKHGIGPPCPFGDRGFVGDLPEDCPCAAEGE